MARLMYEFLRDSGVSDNAVSGRLHYASRTLRDEWVHEEFHARGHGLGAQEPNRDMRAERDVLLCEPLEPKIPLWVPYVHYGV